MLSRADSLLLTAETENIAKSFLWEIWLLLGSQYQ